MPEAPKDDQWIEMRPGAPGFTRWRGLWTEGDPGSVVPGHLLEGWNIRFDGQIVRSRPGQVKAFSIPLGDIGEGAPDPAAIVSHHVASPPRRLLVMDGSLGSWDVERPKFGDFTAGISVQTLPCLDTVSSSMVGSMTCPPKWHDEKLYGGIVASDRGALVELSSTPNFDTLRGRTIYEFGADVAIVGLLSISDGLLVVTEEAGTGSSGIYLWADGKMTSEVAGIDTVGCLCKHNDKVVTLAYGIGEDFIRIRSAAGVWTTKAPASGTLAGEKFSFNTLASVGKYVFIASGNEDLFAYDDEANTLTAVHTLVNSDASITSVASWLGSQCVFCWFDTTAPTDGFSVGRYETRATASQGVDAVMSFPVNPSDPTEFASIIIDDFSVQYPRAIIAYKNRVYIRFASGMMVSPAQSLSQPGAQSGLYGGRAWHYIHIGVPYSESGTGGLVVV